MSEVPQQPEITRPVELFSLSQKERALERVRLVNGMKIVSVGKLDQPAWPIDLVGDAEQAVAFLDLVYQTSPPGSLGVVINGGTSLRADMSLAVKLNETGGILPVEGQDKATTVVNIEQDKQTGKYHCRYGYSAKGTSIEITYGNHLNVNIRSPFSIVDESLYRLYKLTGNPSFIEILGILAELRGRGAASALSKAIDPEGYYATLGLNPYALRFMDKDVFEALIKGMKRAVAKKLHPDVAHPTKVKLDHLKRMLVACRVLEDEEERRRYTAWLND